MIRRSAGPALLFAFAALGLGCVERGGPAADPGYPAGVPVLHVATEEPGCPDAASGSSSRSPSPCDRSPVAPKVASVPCSNGSLSDCNVKGTTLLPESAWVDPEPPEGWRQCAGFLNTEADDVTHDFLDNCLRAKRLRIRVWAPGGRLEEDVAAEGMPAAGAWPSWNYLGGDPVLERKTHWGDTTFFTATDGKDACLRVAAPGGTTFGSGNANVAIIAGANRGADEYRVSCGGKSLPGRKIALYRDEIVPVQQAGEPAR